jgi:hypothetical protein
MWAITSSVSISTYLYIYQCKCGINMTQAHTVWCNKHHSNRVQDRTVHRVSTSACTGCVSANIISEHKYISISISLTSTWYRHPQCDATSISLIHTVCIREVHIAPTWVSGGNVSYNIISEHNYVSGSISLASTSCRHSKLDATSIILIRYRPEKSTAYQHSQYRLCEQ